MTDDDMGETIELRRRLSKLKHQGLEGMSYVRKQIFTTCETADCGSYVCNLSTGQIEESYGLARAIVDSDRPLTVQEIDCHTHPLDRKKIHSILDALYELGKEKLITSQDRLSCVYRVKLDSRYIQVNRKSGLAIKENTGEVLNWSNLYAMSNLPPLNYVWFRWIGKNFSHDDLMEVLKRKQVRLFTRKESAIATAIKDGLSSPEIANSLHISPETLKKHLSNMFKKTRAKSRIQLLKYFERNQKE